MGAGGAMAEILDALGGYRAPSAEGRLSLPPRAYVDAALFERERERVFLKEWICVGHQSAFAAAGDYVALSIAGEPVVVIRGGDGGLRAFSNVCRHRLFPLLAEGSGSTRRLTCAYHQWVYDLEGALRGAPHMEGTPGFDPAACALPAFGVETWQGFVFVNMGGGAEPLRPRLAGIEAQIARHRIAGSEVMADYRKVWAGNWKLAVENASESYHHLGLHAQTVQPYMPAAGTYLREATAAWTDHRTPVAEDSYFRMRGQAGFATDLDAEDRKEMKVFTVFPAFVLLTVGDFTQGLSFIPRTVDSVDVRVTSLTDPRALATDESLEAERAAARARVDAINAEDEAATALLQANAASRFAARGWLSDKEGALPGFYAYLARALAD